MSKFILMVSHSFSSVKKAGLMLILWFMITSLTAISRADQEVIDFVDLEKGEGDTAVHTPTDVIGPQHWVTLMCKFSDVAEEPQNASFFDDMFERTSGPSLTDYWREVSYNNIPDTTTDVYGWFTLPHDQAFYGFSSTVPGYDAAGIIDDCTNAADAAVNFANYDAVAVMLNSPAPVAITTVFSFFPDNTQMDINPITIPSNKYNLALVAHEMGHGYGLPHSSANGEEYANPWDLMGISSGYRCSVNADPIYSCLGQHLIAAFKDQLGWIADDKKFEAPQGISTITLERLALPQTNNYLMATIQAGLDTYIIEARQRTGYDTKLAGDAVLIHRFSNLIDADGSAPHDDEGAMWIPGEIYTNATANFSVSVDSATASGFVITINNQNQSNPMSVQLSVSPIAPNTNEQVDFDAHIIYQDPGFGIANNMMVTVTIPNELTYVPNSATTSIGSIASTDPLVFNLGAVNSFTPVLLDFAATVDGTVTTPTTIQVPIVISWNDEQVSNNYTLIANAEQVYLPLILRQ